MNKINHYFYVIISVYNAVKYLKIHINSIVNQSFSDFEIIIIDDYSNVNCIEISNPYKDQIIIYIKLEENISTLLDRKIKTINAKCLTNIYFDTELKLNILENIYNTLKDNNYDVIQFAVEPALLSYDKKKEKIVFKCIATEINNIDNNYLLNGKILNNVAAIFFKFYILKKNIMYITNTHIIFFNNIQQCLTFLYFIKSYKAICDKLDKYDYIKLACNQYEFILYKINNNYSIYISILNKYFDKDFFKEYNHYLKTEEKLKNINDKNYSTYIVISFINILIILFSMQFSKQNTKINLLEFNFVLEKRG